MHRRASRAITVFKDCNINNYCFTLKLVPNVPVGVELYKIMYIYIYISNLIQIYMYANENENRI